MIRKLVRKHWGGDELKNKAEQGEHTAEQTTETAEQAADDATDGERGLEGCVGWEDGAVEERGELDECLASGGVGEQRCVEGADYDLEDPE